MCRRLCVTIIAAWVHLIKSDSVDSSADASLSENFGLTDQNYRDVKSCFGMAVSGFSLATFVRRKNILLLQNADA